MKKGGKMRDHAVQTMLRTADCTEICRKCEKNSLVFRLFILSLVT